MNKYEKTELIRMKSDCELLILLINECIETGEICPINEKLIRNTQFTIGEYSI